MIYYNCYETYATNNSFRHVFDLSKIFNISNLRYELQVVIHCTCVRESPTRRTFFHRDLAGVTPADMITSTYGGLFGLIFYYTSKPRCHSIHRNDVVLKRSLNLWHYFSSPGLKAILVCRQYKKISIQCFKTQMGWNLLIVICLFIKRRKKLSSSNLVFIYIII